MSIKPILFNKEMVQAILDGKGVTRRPVKQKYSNTEFKMKTDKYGTRLIEIQKDIEGKTFGKNPDGSTWHKLLGYIEPQCQYKKRDILYVRESGMIQSMEEHSRKVKMLFAADNEVVEFAVSEKEYQRLSKYESSKSFLSPYWMTKETARIWLKVTDVRVERLQEITNDQIVREGADPEEIRHYIAQMPEETEEWVRAAHALAFSGLWNSTVKKVNMEQYGWEADPWVWVIEFEQCEN